MPGAVNRTRRNFLLGRPALAPVDPSAPNLPQLADNCLALHQVVCQACGDICDQRAITFIPRMGAVAVPRIDTDACNGCGDCVSACPSDALSLTPSGSHTAHA